MKLNFYQNRFLSDKSRDFFDRRKLHLSNVGGRLCLKEFYPLKVRIEYLVLILFS